MTLIYLLITVQNLFSSWGLKQRVHICLLLATLINYHWLGFCVIISDCLEKRAINNGKRYIPARRLPWPVPNGEAYIEDKNAMLAGRKILPSLSNCKHFDIGKLHRMWHWIYLFSSFFTQIGHIYLYLDESMRIKKRTRYLCMQNRDGFGLFHTKMDPLFIGWVLNRFFNVMFATTYFKELSEFFFYFYLGDRRVYSTDCDYYC